MGPMAKKKNPYHLWLGFPPEVNSPDYFQLLGLQRTITDPQLIATTASHNAQKLLGRLKQANIKNDSEKAIRDKLKARIVTAHKTLTDSQKRQQYMVSVAAKTTQTRKTTAESSSPKPNVSKPPTDKDANDSKSKLPRQPTSSPETRGNVPLAIPLAVPLTTVSPPEQPPVPSTHVPAQSNRDAPNGILINSINDEEIVNVRPVRARRKRSSAIPIVVMLLVTSIIGGLVYLLSKYHNVFDVLAKRNQSNQTPSVADRSPTNFPSAALSARDSDKPKTEQDRPSLTTPKTFEELKNAQEQQRQRTESGSADKASDDTNPARGGSIKPSNQPTDAVSNSSTTEDLDPSDSSTLRVAANLVRVALLRRDISAAKVANDQITTLLKNNDSWSAGAIRVLQNEHQKNQNMIGHLQVFLQQVKSAAGEIAGGQDIIVGNLVMALVDSGPTKVTLRTAGRNEVIPYRSLPNSIAIAIGDQGTKESVPRWNMAKAADLIIQSKKNAKLLSKAKPFLDQSIADGYGDASKAITAFADAQWQELNLPQNRPSDPTKDQTEQLLQDLRSANGYANPRGLQNDQANELLEKLLFSPAPSPKVRVARLIEAIAIAANLKRFDAMFVATEEIYRLSNPVNVTHTLVKPIDRLMRVDMTATEARHFVVILLQLVRQHDQRTHFRAKATPKLLRHAQTLVEEFEFVELEPQVKKLAGQ